MRFPVDPDKVNATFGKLESKARADLRSDGFKDDSGIIRRYVDLKFRRQVHVLRTPVKNGPLTGQDLDELCNDFEKTYELRYGKGSAFRAAGIEITTFIVEGTGPVLKPVLRRFEGSSRIPADAVMGKRKCYFVDPNDPSAPLSMSDTPVYRLPGLVAGNGFQGPGIIETPVTTIVVQPGQNANVDEYLNVVIEIPSNRED
jgi:N-methylhydantoinase A